MLSYASFPSRLCSGLLLLLAVATFSVADNSKHFDLLTGVKHFELVAPRLLSNDKYELQSNTNNNNAGATKTYPDHAEYEFQAFGKNMHVTLEKNKELFTPNYVEIKYGANNEVLPTQPNSNNIDALNCHYWGFEGRNSESRVALSTCDGLRGLISSAGETYYIEPAAAHLNSLQDRLSGMDPNTAHVMYRVQDLVQTEFGCGVDHAHTHNTAPTEQAHSTGHDLDELLNKFIPMFNQQKDKAQQQQEQEQQEQQQQEEQQEQQQQQEQEQELDLNENDEKNTTNQQDAAPKTYTHTRSLKQALPSTLYVELLFVNDVSRYRSLGNQAEIRSASYLNMMNSFYGNSGFSPVIKIVLVAQVTFTVSDPYTYSFIGPNVDVNTLLNNFHQWRSTANIPAHDAGQLLTSMIFNGNIIGYAGVGTMCVRSASGGIIQATNSDLVNSMVCAHEMGHNFGMQHDSTGNSCPSSGYIMAAVSCTSCSASAVFSSCSHSYMTSWLASSTLYSCLDNVPTTSWSSSVSHCGDGIVDSGEQCDCGATCNLDPCCDGTTCQLRTTAPAGASPANYPAQCSNLSPCCNNCQVVPLAANLTCRPSVSACDVAETCSGFSGNCPADSYLAAGTTCNDGAGGSGQCYAGNCYSYREQCTNLNSVFTGSAPLVPCNYQANWGACGTLYCGVSGSGTTCNAFTTGGSTVLVASGTPCGASSQCVNGTCVASSSLNPVVTYSYQATAWSTCSGSCGTGTQSRVVACVSSQGSVVASTKCAGQAAPATSQACTLANACPPPVTPPVTSVYTWVLGAWSACSATCGIGLQTAYVTCQDQNGQVVANALCNAAAMPTTTQICSMPACSVFSWVAGLWSSCSTTCDPGTQTRAVVCETQSGTVVANAFCTAATQPVTQQACNNGACAAITPTPTPTPTNPTTGLWFASSWSACSVTCGYGLQTRAVSCRTPTGTLLPSTSCTGAAPPTAMACAQPSC